MSKVEDFLTAQEEKEIVNAIIEAEKNTSGEIRVHIEKHSDNDHYARTQALFHQLKMDNTLDGNGVLIYVAVDDRKFVIYGDKGINKIVGQDFWDSTKDIMQHYFKKGKFKEGIIAGVLKAGEELEKHFPWKHHDTNELSNEVSKS